MHPGRGRGLHARGVRHVWVRLGERGSLLRTPARSRPSASGPVDGRDVTGAGDAMLGAFCHALLEGGTPVEAAAYGHAAAAAHHCRTRTVRPDLSATLVPSCSDDRTR